MSTLPRLSVFALSAVLGSAFLFAGSADARKRGGGFGPAHEPTEAQKEVRSLKHEIAVTELFFALALENDQKTALARVVADVVAEREARQAARVADAPEIADLLKDYLDEVKKDGVPDADVVASLKALRVERQGDREAQRGQRQKIKETLQSILSEEQEEVLRSFRPMADLGPSTEELAERMEAKQERFRQRASRHGISGDQTDDMMMRRAERGMGKRERHNGMHNVHRLLFTAEMLDLLD